MVLTGKGATERLAPACAAADLVVIGARVETPPAGCIVLDQSRLAETGAVAVWLTGNELRLRSTRQVPRIWVGKPMAADALPDLDPRPDDAAVALR